MIDDGGNLPVIQLQQSGGKRPRGKGRVLVPGDSQQQVVKTTRFLAFENRVAANRNRSDSAPVQHPAERAALAAGAHQDRDIAAVYRVLRDTGAPFEHGADFIRDRLVNQLAHFAARIVVAIGLLR